MPLENVGSIITPPPLGARKILSKGGKQVCDQSPPPVGPSNANCPKVGQEGALEYPPPPLDCQKPWKVEERSAVLKKMKMESRAKFPAASVLQ